MNKMILKSKTFWFGLFTAIAPLIPSVQLFMESNMIMLTSLWGAAAILLRMVTKDKIVLVE